jgi:hypothetical protein
VKKTITYVLLLFYCSIPLRPLLVLLTDAIAHTVNKMEHLATVHYENGHYHLHQELKAMDESETQQKNPSHKTAASKYVDTDSEQLFTTLKLTFPNPSEKIRGFIQIESTLPSGFTQIPYNPPKIV